MEYFEKKITYLRGLCDGSDFPAESKEGKIFQLVKSRLRCRFVFDPQHLNTFFF